MLQIILTFFLKSLQHIINLAMVSLESTDSMGQRITHPKRNCDEDVQDTFETKIKVEDSQDTVEMKRKGEEDSVNYIN